MEEEKDVSTDIAFDPTDFRTICRLGGFRDLPALHPGGKRTDGDLRDMGGEINRES